jgi:hypothetical protein
MLVKLLTQIRIILTGWRFQRSVERNNKAADRLDSLVREVMKK